MAGHGDRDILLPEERPRLQMLGRLRAVLRRFEWPIRKGPSEKSTSDIGPNDLWAALEYLVGEYEQTGALREDLADTLAMRFAGQTGQGRFELQCKLAAVLAERKTVRFHVGLRVAAQTPVPQARTALLEMLTQPDLARWRPGGADGPQTAEGHPEGYDGSKGELPRWNGTASGSMHPQARDGSTWQPVASGNGDGQETGGLDLRPAVVAALGQLRDPSLLGLFHRLLEKLSSGPAGCEKVIAAVQWSLMNLAPGGQGEPVPAMILATVDREEEPACDTQTARPATDGASTAEALRVVASLRERLKAAEAQPGGNGTSAPAGNGQGNGSQDSPAKASERDELLSGF